MNDQLLIQNNLTLAGRAGAVDRPWILRGYILAFCFAPSVIVLLLGRQAYDPSTLVLSGHVALACGSYFALFLLRDKPLLNPIQAVVFLFHWWFAVGPGMAVLFGALRNDPDLLDKYASFGGEALWIVAVGLPLYALCAKQTMFFSRGRIKPLAFLMPEGPLYLPKTLYVYWIFGGLLTLIIAVLGRFGIVGNVPVNYLGGKMSENWFVSSLETISGVALIATVGVIGYLTGPYEKHSPKFKIIAIGLIAFNTVTALFSGWKGAIVQTFALLFIVRLIWRQKIPGVLVILLAVSYLFVIEPFVSQMRMAAEIAHIETPEERTELFMTAMDQGISIDELRDIQVNIESPFRFVYEYANGITEESTFFEGPWEGTISEGLLALVPRAIYPDKPEGHIGNFFARYFGNAAPDNYEQSLGVSIPFEVLGNYGYVAGILSFALIGILWTALVVWILSEDRLATHPLTPLAIIYALSMESSIGAFLARLRDLPLVLGAAFLIWYMMKKHL